MMYRRSIFGLAIGFLLTLGMYSAAFAQSADPSEIIQRAARTRVSTARQTARPAKPAVVTAQIAVQKENPVSVVSKPQVIPAEQSAPASTQHRAESNVIPASTSGMSIVLVGIAVLASFAGTVVLLAFIQRVLQQRMQSSPRQAAVAIPPVRMELQAIPIEPTEGTKPSEVEEQAEAHDSGQRYQPGTGEMELAMAIERLKRELPVPSLPKKRTVPKTRSGRIAAARKLGKGSGELELAARLEQLRAASASVQEGL